ncbi:MAG: resolvase [Rhodoglobus sp.]|nr:resolvase [Rhodoglobus sp.]
MEEHYKTVKLSPEFVAAPRASLESVLRESESAQHLLRDQLAAQLEQIKVREENLLDLAADGTLPRLRTLAAEREEAQARLTETSTDLAVGAKAIDEFLKVLDDPMSSISA